MLALAPVLPPTTYGDRGFGESFRPPAAMRVQNGGLVLDLKHPPKGMRAAVGDGRADDTEAFRDAYDLLARGFREGGGWNPTVYTIYLPKGTYRVSDTLVYRGETIQQPKGQWKGENWDFNHLRIVGESRTGTVIRLADRTPGFDHPAKPKWLLAYQHPDTIFNNVPGSNVLRNLTVSIGRGNPGAVGVAFQGANQTDLRGVTIRSEDGAGAAGLLFPIGSVQGSFADVTVDGFDVGIKDPVNAEGNPAFEHLTLRNQRQCGILHTGGGLSLRKLLSEQRALIPAVKIEGEGAHTVMLDSRLTSGARADAAIRMSRDERQTLFARNVATEGYARALDRPTVPVGLGAQIAEVALPAAFAREGQTPRSLDLPVEDSPPFPSFDPAREWAFVEDYGGLQAAMDSGRPCVAFRGRTVRAEGEVRVPASVRLIEGMNVPVQGDPTLVVAEDSARPLFLRDTGFRVRFEAKRDLVARCVGGKITNPKAFPVTMFVENANDLTTGDEFCPRGSRVFARSLDVEYGQGEQIACAGGALWIFGFKTENANAEPFTVRSGGSLEILGGYVNTTGAPGENPLLKIEAGSRASVSLFTNLGGKWSRTILDRGTVWPWTAFPKRGGYETDISIPLYSSR